MENAFHPKLEVGEKQKPGIERVQALAFGLCCHSNETRAPNPPNSAQLEGTHYHSPSYIRVRMQ